MSVDRAALEAARSWLFVPGDRPERFAKAVASGADAVILDLEDAVDPSNKVAAREAVVAAIAEGGSYVVRLNAPDTADFELDLAALAAVSEKLSAVVVAKSESADGIRRVTAVLPCPVVALIESAVGLLAASEIASVDAVVRLAFGAVDYALDIDAVGGPEVLAYPRSVLVTASRAAGKAAPLDTPSLEFRDLDVVAADVALARRFGMGGKLCIHPAQVAVSAAAFRPTDDEVERARALLASAVGEGAGSANGQMIDRPVLERARRVLAAAGLEES